MKRQPRRPALIERLEERTLLSVSLWANNPVPAVVDALDPGAVEVGVRFSSEKAGYVSAVRFYKSAANIGTHIGHLWTAGGTELGSVTFTNETASGWQQANFDSPLLIAANTPYIASYFAPAGHYAADAGYFATTGVDAAPLHAPQDGGQGNGNGVFAYTGAPGAFPGGTFNANNYWVDVVFDALAPQVASSSPAAGATNVNPAAYPTVTFSEAMDASTVNATTVVLRDASNVAVPATVAYDAATLTATIVPNAPLRLNRAYTLVVSGAKAAGQESIPAYSASFRTASVQQPLTLFSDTAQPANPSVVDNEPLELGVRFRSDVDGAVTGVRFYKGTQSTGTHVGSLWKADGTLLARATFVDEPATGWTQVLFATPVPIVKDTDYVASYFAPNGAYAADTGFFATAGVTNRPLHAPANAVGAGNGVFAQSAQPTFPGQSFNSNNYWVDVLFLPPGLPANLPAPTAQAVSASVKEDAVATILLKADGEPAQVSSAIFRIQTLPTAGVLRYNGAPVTAGQTFTGPPANLTYEPGAETEGGTTDAFTFNVVDGDGNPTGPAATATIAVTKAVADGTAVLGSDGVLRVGGTSGIDLITISRTPGGKFRVALGLRIISDTVPVSAVSEIRVWARQGVDGIALLDVNTRSLLSGGAGTDVIVGGNGDDLIVGGAGDDVLTGMSGNDVIVGGDGRDALLGMDGHDILIAGQISRTTTASTLRAMGSEWAASKATTAPEAAEAERIVTDDDFDLLTGGGGSDWFIVSRGDFVLDYSVRSGSADKVTYVS